MLAAPVVGPGKAAFDKAGVNRIHHVARTDDSTCRQNFDDKRAARQGSHVGAEVLEHDDFVSSIGQHRLNAQDLLGHGRGCHQHGADGSRRCHFG